MIDLTFSDRNSPTWHKLREFFAERLQAAREQNDRDMDERKRAALVGRIALLKELIALDKPAQTVEASGQDM